MTNPEELIHSRQLRSGVPRYRVVNFGIGTSPESPNEVVLAFHIQPTNKLLPESVQETVVLLDFAVAASLSARLSQVVNPK